VASLVLLQLRSLATNRYHSIHSPLYGSDWNTIIDKLLSPYIIKPPLKQHIQLLAHHTSRTQHSWSTITPAGGQKSLVRSKTSQLPRTFIRLKVKRLARGLSHIRESLGNHACVARVVALMISDCSQYTFRYVDEVACLPCFGVLGSRPCVPPGVREGSARRVCSRRL
jgi:hypothetical protein